MIDFTDTDTEARVWYDQLFASRERPNRYYANFKERWGFRSDHVDPAVIDLFDHLKRGSVKRLASKLQTKLSLDTIYRCVAGDSVGECVAVDFEFAFGKYLWSPNFDTPPCAPPADLEELSAWIKEHVGTRGWIAEQLGINETAVGNALHGRSKAVECRIRDFCADFYARRVDMDVRNPSYEEEYAQYERDLWWRAIRMHQIAWDLYKRAKDSWEASPEKRELDRNVRGGADRCEEINRLTKQGVDTSTELRGFRPWCEVCRNRILEETMAQGLPHALYPPSEWILAMLGKRLNP